MGYPAVTGDAAGLHTSVNPCAAPDAYDREREAVLDESEFYLDALHPWERRDYLSAICGVSEPWHDLCSEGFPACGR